MSPEEFNAIVVFGPPGSGKGTQSELLTKVADIYHLSTGEMLRNMPVDTREMQEYRKLIDSGQYIPDHAIMEIFSSYIDAEVKKNNLNPAKELLLLDGLPRTVEQAHALEKLATVVRVVSFTIPDEAKLIERIQKRAKLSGRSDDASYDVLKTRMNVYREKTAPILEHFDPSLVVEINADQKPLEVFRDLLQATASFLPLTLEK